MAYKSGVGSVLQAGVQSSWGTSVAPDTLINMTSEGINLTINKESEGSLLGSKTEQSRDLTSIRVDGSVSTILKPEFAEFIFKQALGIETTGTNLKRYTLANPGVDLPLSTFVLRRGGEETSKWNEKTYPDITITSISIEATAQQYVTCDLNIVGTKELNAEQTGAQELDNLSFTKGSYRCTSASLVFGDAGTNPTAGSTCFPVESTTITIDNGVTESPATYCSGFYAERPIMGQRTVNVSFTIPYNVLTENFREAYYKSEHEVAFKLKFTSKDSPDEYVEIFMPKVALTNGSGNVGGAELIDCSFEGVALTPASNATYNEPIQITVHHQAVTTD